jgi:hypothetical protein
MVQRKSPPLWRAVQFQIELELSLAFRTPDGADGGELRWSSSSRSITICRLRPRRPAGTDKTKVV